MDDFKRANVGLATAWDYNARCVKTRPSTRRALKKIINRYARRKLKEELRRENIIERSEISAPERWLQ